MKTRIITAMLALIMLLSTVSILGVASAAEGEMAYNIYSEPLPSGTMLDSFTIEFKSTQTPAATYWSLANFGWYISEQTKRRYRGITAGGSYAGLQDHGNRTAAIIAFWEWYYKDENSEQQKLHAWRMYPECRKCPNCTPKDHHSYFGGEGEGVNWITTYTWEDDHWYRMLLHTWTDIETATTFCGLWFEDVETHEWKLITYFDTKLINSCMQGNMHFFMENYVGTTIDEERDVFMRNIYYIPHGTSEWKSNPSTVLSHCNNWANNKLGNHSFGATEEFFWAKSGGLLDDPSKQAELDRSQPPQEFTITQPDQPTFAEPAFKELRIMENSDGEMAIRWKMEKDSTPQLSYSVSIKDADGKSLYVKQATRPHINLIELDDLGTDVFTCSVTVTDTFGKSVTTTAVSPKYAELYPEEEEPSETPDGGEDAPTVDEKDEKNEGNSNMGLIITIAAVAAVVVIGGVVTAVLVLKKKKK